jgi:uncharacterized phiE125 gp8 family phage protein
MPHILITGATTYAVSLDEAKAHLRVESTNDDTLIPLYLKAAELQSEALTGRSVSPQTWKLIIDDFPGDTEAIELPRCPVSSSASDVTVIYIAASGATVTLAASCYTVDVEGEPGCIRLVRDSSGGYGEWPDTLDHPRAVQISYVSGCSSSLVPEPIKQWIKMRAGQMYEIREPVGNAQNFNLRRDFVDGLLDQYIVYPSRYFGGSE